MSLAYPTTKGTHVPRSMGVQEKVLEFLAVVGEGQHVTANELAKATGLDRARVVAAMLTIMKDGLAPGFFKVKNGIYSRGPAPVPAPEEVVKQLRLMGPAPAPEETVKQLRLMVVRRRPDGAAVAVDPDGAVYLVTHIA